MSSSLSTCNEKKRFLQHTLKRKWGNTSNTHKQKTWTDSFSVTLWKRFLHRNQRNYWHKLTQWGHEITWMNQVHLLTQTQCVLSVQPSPLSLAALASPLLFHPLPTLHPRRFAAKSSAGQFWLCFKLILIITLDYRERGSWQVTAEPLSARLQMCITARKDKCNTVIYA